MVDIETSATCHEAKLLSIGACAFQFDRPPDLGKLLSRTFYTNVGSYESHSQFIESVTTLMWWEQQGDEAKQVLENDRKPPREAISSFISWVRGIWDSYGEGTIWANPPQFDLSIIQHHFDVFGFNCPWHYSKERCFRTIREVARQKQGFVPSEPKAVAVGGKTVVFVKHNALHDAIMQADKLQQIIQHLRK
jgi:hypothetical protein